MAMSRAVVTWVVRSWEIQGISAGFDMLCWFCWQKDWVPETDKKVPTDYDMAISSKCIGHLWMAHNQGSLQSPSTQQL